jgi:hypothetical protein
VTKLDSDGRSLHEETHFSLAKFYEQHKQRFGIPLVHIFLTCPLLPIRNPALQRNFFEISHSPHSIHHMLMGNAILCGRSFQLHFHTKDSSGLKLSSSLPSCHESGDYHDMPARKIACLRLGSVTSTKPSRPCYGFSDWSIPSSSLNPIPFVDGMHS